MSGKNAKFGVVKRPRPTEASSTFSNSNELSRIDCGLSSLANLPLTDSITILNLHFNNIKVISHLDQAVSLRHLDLSSNLIQKIQGLDKLHSLRTLNLASNQISVVEGLQGLKNLVKCNLSYNRLRDLSGFELLSGSSHLLTDVELQGNELRSTIALVRCMKSLTHLRRLTLSAGQQKNPLCSVKNYRQTVLLGLPQLTVLDGMDRSGTEVLLDVFSDIPGLDDFLDVLSSGSSSHNKFPTPKVDAALKAFREIPPANSVTPPPPSSNSLSEGDNNQTISTNQSSASTKQACEKLGESKPMKTEAKKTKTVSEEKSSEASVKTGRKREAEGQENAGKEAPVLQSSRSTDVTFGQILRELDSERERRWKAEEACRRLSDHLRSLQEEMKNGSTVQTAAISATANLREALLQEKDHSNALQEDLQELQTAYQTVCDDKEHWQAEAVRLNDTVKQLRADQLLEVNKLTNKQQQTLMELQEAQSAEKQWKKEIHQSTELLEHARSEIKQLQSMLLHKEKEFQDEGRHRYTLDSSHVQEHVTRQVAVHEKQAKQTQQLLEKSIFEWQKKYSSLEDEFRLALRIEANRHEKLCVAYKALQSEFEKVKVNAEQSKRKESESKMLITEMAQLVKEQKSKLQEVSTVKMEMDRVYKERVGTLEMHLDEARKRMIQLEMLKQENKKLIGQIEGQESIIEGLRSERKLWSEELAQQGSSLAQDRGRLESKIESLNSEVITLKINLERETDAVRVKAKLIEDQTEVIRKLKEGLQEKDNIIKSLQNKIIHLQDKVTHDSVEERRELDELKLRYNELFKRKESLKEDLQVHKEQANELQRANDALNQKWRDKGNLIDRLERQVKQMQQHWDEKEATLIKEKTSATEDVKNLQTRLAQMDTAFRDQLKTAEQKREEVLQQMKRECSQEVEKSRTRVRQVEQEMREILRESERSKQMMEEKVHRLTAAFHDLTGTLRSN